MITVNRAAAPGAGGDPTSLVIAVDAFSREIEPVPSSPATSSTR